MDALIGFIIVVFLLYLYFLPTVLAFKRQTPNRMSVGVIDFFFGWTLLGWVVALAMALSNAPARRQ